MSRSEERAAGWKGEDRKILTTTYVLITLNVLVFVAMVASGVSILSPTLAEAVAWGADYGPLTSGAGQWWRLLTACFVHFGIVHIALNMYVLYQIGPFVDRMFGRARYVFIICSLVWAAVSSASGYIHDLWVQALPARFSGYTEPSSDFLRCTG